MPLTQLNNRESVFIEVPSSKKVDIACVAKNTIVNATLLLGDQFDPYDDASFPITINDVECDATITTSLDGLTSIDFIIADASSPHHPENATFIFTLRRDDEGKWVVGDNVTLVQEQEAGTEEFYGLKWSEQLRLLGY